MLELFELFKQIAENYGEPIALIIIMMISIIYGTLWTTKNLPKLISRQLDSSSKDAEKAHAEASKYRKSITPEIRRILSDLALETNADRALVFEFSNGNSNLIGLPFLYASATCEVVGSGVAPVMQQYQRMNLAMVAEFLEKLEEKGYTFIADLDETKNTHPVIYNLMSPNGVKSALFYALYGASDTLGFVVLTTINNHMFTRDETLPRIAEAAQLISSLLNFDRLHEELE